LTHAVFVIKKVKGSKFIAQTFVDGRSATFTASLEDAKKYLGSDLDTAASECPEDCRIFRLKFILGKQVDEV